MMGTITAGMGTLRLPALDFGRPELEAAAAGLVELPGHPDGAGGQVDIAAPQAAQLAPAEAAEHGQQDQRAVPLADRIGERVDLRDGQRRPLG